MLTAAYIVAFASLAGADLIQNGGYENLNAGRPTSWDVFVQPPEGEAIVSADAHSGEKSVMVRNHQRYAEDPCNNWSQIINGVSGKKLRVKAWIKTDSADAAALWLQCWQTRPLRVIYLANSSEKTPISGTRDWTEVSMTVDVPPETAFTVLRCVLKGEGAAWFDDVSVTEALAGKKKADEEPAPPPPPEKESPAKYLQMLQEATEEMKAYRQANEELSRQVQELQNEIQTLKTELQEQKQRPPAPTTTIILDRPQKTSGGAHILVPVEKKKEADKP